MRLAGAHRDPEKEPLLRELSERYPAGVGSHTPAATSSRAARRCSCPTSATRTMRACAVDERHAELIEQLGTRSGIVVPLVARDAQARAR